MTPQQKLLVKYLTSKHWKVTEQKKVLVAFDNEGHYVNVAAGIFGEEVYPLDFENRDAYDRIDVIKGELKDADNLLLEHMYGVMPTRLSTREESLC